MGATDKPAIFYDNILETGTLSATDTDSTDDYSVDNILDLRTFTYHKFAASGTKYYTLDYGSAVSADSLFIVGHNLNTANASVRVEYSSDYFVADVNVALAAFSPSSDKAIVKTFTSQSARYWRIRIITASVAAYVGVAILGPMLEFPRQVVPGFAPDPRTVIKESTTSREGHILGNVKQYVGHRGTYQFRALTEAFISTFLTAWEAHLGEKPFGIAWDVTGHNADAFFVEVTDQFTLSPSYERDNSTMQMSLKVKGTIIDA